jgi:hypothetical protein
MLVGERPSPVVALALTDKNMQLTPQDAALPFPLSPVSPFEQTKSREEEQACCIHRAQWRIDLWGATPWPIEKCLPSPSR